MAQKINNTQVAPGPFIGVIPGSTLSTTGNKAITGVGFKPKLVRFTVMPTSNAAISLSSGSTVFGNGAAVSSTSQYAVMVSTQSPGTGLVRTSTTNRCFGFVTGSNVYNLSASLVQMDDNGFTINVLNESPAFDVAYEAYP